MLQPGYISTKNKNKEKFQNKDNNILFRFPFKYITQLFNTYDKLLSLFCCHTNKIKFSQNKYFKILYTLSGAASVSHNVLIDK